MNKFLQKIGLGLSLLSLVVLTSCYALPISGVPRDNKYALNSQVEDMVHATVAIKPYSDNGLTPDENIIGSGTVLRHRAGEFLVVLTAQHVVDAVDDQMWIVECSVSCDDPIPAHTIRKSDKYDLALVISDLPMKENGAQAIVAGVEPAVGDTLFVVGSPNGHNFNVTKGILSSVFLQDNDDETAMPSIKYYRTDAAVFFGNSGGGLWNASGELVGVVVMLEASKYGIVPGSGLAVTLDELWEFIYAKNL